MKKTNANKIYELKKKNEMVAAFYSFLISGLGSIYAGKTIKGIILFIITICLWFMLSGWIMWIITPPLAYIDAIRYNQALQLELDAKGE